MEKKKHAMARRAAIILARCYHYNLHSENWFNQVFTFKRRLREAHICEHHGPHVSRFL